MNDTFRHHPQDCQAGVRRASNCASYCVSSAAVLVLWCLVDDASVRTAVCGSERGQSSESHFDIARRHMNAAFVVGRYYWRVQVAPTLQRGFRMR